MASLGSLNYRVGLIIARSQPFHNGHFKIICDALMMCDEVIFSVRGYDTAFFDYNITQRVFRNLMGKTSDRVAFFGTLTDVTLGTPKQVINRTLERLGEANYHMPTHFFTHEDLWIDPAMELQLTAIKTTRLAGHDSASINESIENGTDFWESKVPHAVLDDIKTYIATKNRDF